MILATTALSSTEQNSSWSAEMIPRMSHIVCLIGGVLWGAGACFWTMTQSSVTAQFTDAAFHTTQRHADAECDPESIDDSAAHTPHKGTQVSEEKPAAIERLNDRLRVAAEDLGPEEFEKWVSSIVADFEEMPIKQAEVLFTAYQASFWGHGDDEATDRLLKSAIERVELARLRLLDLRLQMYAARANQLMRTRGFDEYVAAYNEVVRLFDEVALYSRYRSGDESLKAYRSSVNTYTNALVQLLRARRIVTDEYPSHVAGQPFYLAGFLKACEAEPAYVQYVYCISSTNKREADALSWLRDVLAGKDVFAYLKTKDLDEEALGHVRAVEALIQKDLEKSSERVRQWAIAPGAVNAAEPDDGWKEFLEMLRRTDEQPGT